MRKNLKYYTILICIYLLIFQNIIQQYILIFKYFAELFALSLIPVFAIKVAKNRGKFRINKRDLLIILLLLLIFVVGIIANIKYKYQPLKIAFSDVLLVFKFFLVYFLSKIIMTNEFIDKYKKKYLWHIKFIIIVLFLLTILNYIFNIWPYTERYGIMSNKLFFGHPTSLAAVCIFLMACLFMYTENIKKEKNFFGVILIMVLSTMRSKAMASAIVIFLITIYINKSNKKISFSKFGILALVGVIVAWNQIEYYYITLADEGAREKLTSTAFKIAKDYFPIGTGFGTYASYFSAVYYSSVYYKYHLSNVYGLSPDKTLFTSDTFWPMILGQFGIIGTISYILIIALLFVNIQKSFENNNKGIYLSKICCLVYLLISSTSESAFVHPMAIPLAFVIGAYSKNRLIS